MEITINRTPKRLKLLLDFKFSENTRQWIIFWICLACFALFLSAGYTKVTEHERFVQGLSIVPVVGPYAKLIGWLVPTVETVIAAFIITPRIHRIGLYAFTILMIVFTFYIGSMLLFATKLPCFCNLFIQSLSFSQHLWFNIFFILMSISALWLSKTKNIN